MLMSVGASFQISKANFYRPIWEQPLAVLSTALLPKLPTQSPSQPPGQLSTPSLFRCWGLWLTPHSHDRLQSVTYWGTPGVRAASRLGLTAVIIREGSSRGWDMPPPRDHSSVRGTPDAVPVGAALPVGRVCLGRRQHQAFSSRQRKAAVSLNYHHQLQRFGTMCCPNSCSQQGPLWAQQPPACGLQQCTPAFLLGMHSVMGRYFLLHCWGLFPYLVMQEYRF